jgi:hypothetical protein
MRNKHDCEFFSNCEKKTCINCQTYEPTIDYSLKKATNDFLKCHRVNIEKSKKFIEELELNFEKNFIYSKPERNTIINLDDIINLKIALNSTRSLNEFLKAV